ncbi:MAG: lytic transglycosylase domain-containing protein [Myxococcota bacterium]|nr:lytic transglycosylase domain-containing protein [Myxococcota bacterium]MDW8362959.1 lytic transglycosylase domain-containing protein [Myxococcales bacterium]
MVRVAALACSGLVVAIASGAPSARADIYRCVGADGSEHYTNIRPAHGMRCTVVVRERPGPLRANARRDRVPARDRSPERYVRYDAHIRDAARLYQLPEALLRAVMRVESDFNPNVVSEAGAMGLMQLMPRTAAAMGVRDPFDPRQNVLGGARYLRLLANKFYGDLILTLAAYNAGEGAVLRHRGLPPYEETRRYVRNVLRYYHAFRAAGG